MRSFTLLLVLSLPALILASASEPATKGSLEALLERVSKRTAHAIPVGTIPDELKAPTGAEDSTEEKRAVIEKARQEDTNRMARRSKSWAKRWVWGASIIQDDSPTSGLPAPGVNSNMLSNGNDAHTPTATLVAPTFPALASSSSVPSINVQLVSALAVSEASEASAAAPTPMSNRVGAAAHRSWASKNGQKVPLIKRWIRGPSIIQDGTPASDIPAMSADTPVATLVAPSFPPLNPAPAASSSSPPKPAVASVASSIASAKEASSVVQSPVIAKIVSEVGSFKGPSSAVAAVVTAPAALLSVARMDRMSAVSSRKQNRKTKTTTTTPTPAAPTALGKRGHREHRH